MKSNILLSFILQEKQNRRYLGIAVVGGLIQLVIFKLMYPFPDFISDSYNYIESAILHLPVNLWPIGYAKFIGAFHTITSSDTALVGCQYLLLQGSLLLLFYSLLYFHRPAANTGKILFIFLLFNPAILYLSNAVLSDALFIMLSLLWWVQFMWMMHRPRIHQIFILAALLFAAFTLRYTAMYYPLVAAVAFGLSSHSLRWKVLGSVLGVAVMIPFILYTQSETKKVTGTAEFSVFGGWQLANNAMYMRGNIHVDSNLLPPETRELDRMTVAYYKYAPPGYFNFDDFPGTFFIKHQEAPLKQYMWKYYAKEDRESGMLSWGKVSPIYNAYGKWLIRHYPVEFARDYMWMNTKNYFVPFLEKFDIYNLGLDSAWQPAPYWFHWKTAAVRSVSKTLPGYIFYPYPAIFMALNFYFLFSFLWLLFTRKLGRLDPLFRKSLLLLVTFLIVNFGFSIFATPVVLRYQLIPMILLFCYSMLLLEGGEGKVGKSAEKATMEPV